MLSEFGVVQKAASEGHDTFASSSIRRLSLRRRARSLLSSKGSISSFTDICKSHLRNGSSSSAPSSIETTSSAITTTSIIPQETQHLRKLAHRRLRWTMDENWQPYAEEILNQQGLESDIFLGLALTTPNFVHTDDNFSPTYTGRRPTLRCLRHYHRPTEINVESVTVNLKTVQTKFPQTMTPTGVVFRGSSGKVSPFEGDRDSWSPMLLSPEKLLIGESPLSLCSFNSSSTLTYDSPSPLRPSFDGQREVWRVSSTDEDPLFFKPIFQF